MKVVEVDSGYFLVFYPGDKVRENMMNFLTEKNIRAGSFNGIGAFSEARIAHYTVATKRYMEHDFKDALEVISIIGNISEENGEPYIHMHTVLGTNDMNAFGGHLIEATVGVTLEISMRVFTKPLVRKYNEETGLYLIEK